MPSSERVTMKESAQQPLLEPPQENNDRSPATTRRGTRSKPKRTVARSPAKSSATNSSPESRGTIISDQSPESKMDAKGDDTDMPNVLQWRGYSQAVGPANFGIASKGFKGKAFVVKSEEDLENAEKMRGKIVVVAARGGLEERAPEKAEKADAEAVIIVDNEDADDEDDDAASVASSASSPLRHASSVESSLTASLSVSLPVVFVALRCGKLIQSGDEVEYVVEFKDGRIAYDMDFCQVKTLTLPYNDSEDEARRFNILAHFLNTDVNCSGQLDGDELEQYRKHVKGKPMEGVVDQIITHLADSDQPLDYANFQSVARMLFQSKFSVLKPTWLTQATWRALPPPPKETYCFDRRTRQVIDPAMLPKAVKKEARSRMGLADLVAAVPELEGCFDPVTGIPKVQVSVEIESILDVNVEEEFIEIAYGVCLDWMDIFSWQQYLLQQQNDDFFKSEYPFDPKFRLCNEISSDAETQKGKGGIRFSKRFEVGQHNVRIIESPPEHKDDSSEGEDVEEKIAKYLVPKENGKDGRGKKMGLQYLIQLKKTMKSTAKIRQLFGTGLTKYPLDVHTLILELEAVSLDKKAVQKYMIDGRQLSASKTSVSYSKSLNFSFDSEPRLRVKELKAYDGEECVVSTTKHFIRTYPFMAVQVARNTDYYFDCALKHRVDDSKYIVETKFYREASGFVVQCMVPVLLTICMALFAEWIPHDEIGSRLGLLVTLCVALYAQKYVMVQQLKTIQTTSMEKVMLMGYICIFMQALVSVLSAPMIPISRLGWDPDDFFLHPFGSFLLQLMMIVAMFGLVIGYSVLAAQHTADLNAVKRKNQTVIKQWLYQQLTSAQKAQLVVAKEYHHIIGRVTKNEADCIKACLRVVPKIQEMVPQELRLTNRTQIGPLEERTEPYQIVVDYEVDDHVVDHMERMLARLKHYGKFVAVDEAKKHPSAQQCKVHCKDPQDMKIKVEIREKVLNDKYRAMFVYDDAEEIKETLEALFACSFDANAGKETKKGRRESRVAPLEGSADHMASVVPEASNKALVILLKDTYEALKVGAFDVPDNFIQRLQSYSEQLYLRPNMSPERVKLLIGTRLEHLEAMDDDLKTAALDEEQYVTVGNPMTKGGTGMAGSSGRPLKREVEYRKHRTELKEHGATIGQHCLDGNWKGAERQFSKMKKSAPTPAAKRLHDDWRKLDESFKWKILKVDTNLDDGTHPMFVRVYLQFDYKRDGGMKVPHTLNECYFEEKVEFLEISFLSALSHEELKSNNVHTMYRVMRLQDVSDQKRAIMQKWFKTEIPGMGPCSLISSAV